ncbi:hypothetical protein [Nocardia sp. NPDC059239]|uniref:hypothetical protein n=1 Tax=unclassified Nocardia TaxID=2637762 RepID=UPI003699EAE1
MTSLRPDNTQPVRRIPRTASGAPTTRLLAAAILCGVLGATEVDVGTATADLILCSWGPSVPNDCSDLFTPAAPDQPEQEVSPAYPQFQIAPSQIELPAAQTDPAAAP